MIAITTSSSTRVKPMPAGPFRPAGAGGLPMNRPSPQPSPVRRERVPDSSAVAPRAKAEGRVRASPVGSWPLRMALRPRTLPVNRFKARVADGRTSPRRRRRHQHGGPAFERHRGFRHEGPLRGVGGVRLFEDVVRGLSRPGNRELRLDVEFGPAVRHVGKLELESARSRSRRCARQCWCPPDRLRRSP